MALTTIYDKTPLGRLEIKNRSGELSVLQRRVLILVDGRRDGEKILRISKVVDYAKVLSDLEEMGYIERVSGPDTRMTRQQTARQEAPRQPAPQPQELEPFVGEALQDVDVETRELMLGTLQSYSSPVKTADLIRKINEAQTKDQLKALLDEWYRAVSDNPYAAPIVDDLRSTLVEKLL